MSWIQLEVEEWGYNWFKVEAKYRDTDLKISKMIADATPSKCCNGAENVLQSMSWGK